MGDLFVPPSTDKLSEPIAELPNPDLNPLLNPILGRHLGKWAHVYFTTAPEKREEALFELLDELKAEEARNEELTPGVGVPESTEGIYAIVCPRCERSNLRSQKYCGMCGSLMPVRAQAAAAAMGGQAFGEAMFAPPQEAQTVEEGYTTDATSEVAAKFAREPEFGPPHETFAPTSLLFQPDPPRAVRGDQPLRVEEVEDEPIDIDWLRERNVLTESGRSPFWTVSYVLAGAILVCFVLVLYLGTHRKNLLRSFRSTQSPATSATTSETPSATPSPEGPTSAPPTAKANPLNTVVTVAPPDKSAQANPVDAPDAAEAPNRGLPGASRKHNPVEAPQKTAPAEAEGTATDANQSGSLEVAIAKEYLSGKNGQPDGATAAKMLWKAVAKQNTAALLLLSDLYATGYGVPKSCDQARLLVDAALEKKVPTADVKLHNLQKSCP